MIRWLTDGDTLFFVLVSFGAFISLAGVIMPLLQTGGVNARLKAVAKRREDLRQRQRSEHQRTSRLRREPSNLVRAVVERLKLRERLAGASMRMQLTQAGWRGQAAVITFAFVRFVVPLGAMTLVFVLLSADRYRFGTLVEGGLVLFTGVVGLYLPNILVKNRIQKRQQDFTKSFPDAMDLMLICVESGLSIEASFTKVTEELGPSSPLIAEEFGLTAAELAYLPDRRQALENLAARMGLDSVKSMTTSLIQSERYGTPLAQTLRVLAQENRDSRMAAAEKKAAALPAKLTVPMILFFLPVLFVVILGPAVLQALGK